MLYTSFQFYVFIFMIFILYFITPLKVRKYILLGGSIIFYLLADTRFFLFLFFSILTTYFAGRYFEKGKHKKITFLLVLVLNASLLVFVKYFNYGYSLVGNLFSLGASPISIIVPLGISFYTLQALSYLIDVYRGKIKSEKNILKYTLYMSFFLTIVQGPISKFDQVADQLWKAHKFDYDRVKFGIQLALWGVFKKLVIADRLGIYVDAVFNEYASYSGIIVMIAIFFYTIQIYADFSGCVDFCRGIAQALGIELVNNFNHPYFATSIKDFWSKWHISLSTWLKDYIYIPLGGNRKGQIRKYINILIVFLVSGLWHGVGFHYIVWGLLHGSYQVIGDMATPLKLKAHKTLHLSGALLKCLQTCITFCLVAFAWLFFRANGFKAALLMCQSMFVNIFDITLVSQLGLQRLDYIVIAISLCLLLVVSILQEKVTIRSRIAKCPIVIRWTLYLGIVFSILIFGIYGSGFDKSSFIYMQF